MKLSVVLLAVLAVCGTHQVHSVPVPTRGLSQDLEDFLALVPKEEVTELFFQYLSEDEEFGEALDYVLSEDFKRVVVSIEAMPEVKILVKYLQEAGLDVYELVNKLHDLLGMEHIELLRFAQYKITSGLAGFIKDVKALLPIEKIQKLFEEKLQTSEEFAALITKLKFTEFQGLVNKLAENATLQEVIKKLEGKGVDVQAVFDFLSTVLGLKFPHHVTFSLTRNLKDDLNDFLKLVPQKAIEDLFYEYLSEDEDFGEALDYILSDEFKQLVIDVENMSEVRQLLKFLEESGLDAYEFINKLNDLLGIDRISPVSTLKTRKITGGLPGFIEDVKALLPIDKIEALYKEKLDTSQDFAKLVERLSSKEFQGLVDRIMANPTMKDLIKRAEAKGVDVQAILEIITKILGIKFPGRPTLYMARNLQDDLNDFLSLVPTEAVQDIFYQYLSEDEDFGEALDYVMSTEFRNLVSEIENTPEVKGLLDFLEESGLQAYKSINTVNDLLGIDRIHALYNIKFRKITGGLPGFIADVKAILPLPEIEEMYHLKLKTSESFASLVKRLQSKEFQELTNKIMSNPAVQDLIKRAEVKGVDVQAIFDFLKSIFGFQFPSKPVFSLTRNLKDDLNDLLALVPVDKIQDLFFEYLSEDEDFGEALDYVLSDEFKGLVIEVEGLKEVKSLLEFLVASGLDAYNFINQINDYLGIGHITPVRMVKTRKITGGLPGFIEDVKALLPVDKIEALYDEKLQTSEDLKTLITRLKSAEFQSLVDKLLANSALQNLIKRAEVKGVDVQAIFDFFTTLLGLKFPTRPQVFLARNLKDDLYDLIALVPVKQVQDLFYEYLSNDEDFGQALDYVLSDEFKSMCLEIKDLPEIKELINFLQSAGLDAYGFIEKINKLLGLERINKIYYDGKKITGGLPGFIADVKALLPIEKIRELYQQKLQNSEDFAKLVDHLKSAEFQELVNKLAANGKLQTMIQKLKAKGVDVQAILDFLTTLLGLKFPVPATYKVYRNEEVMKIMETIWSMVPIDDIFDVVLEYIMKDEDFQKVVKYMMTDGFKKNLIDVEELEESKAVLAFLNETGVKVYEYLNLLHYLLGIEKHLPLRRSLRITGGVNGLFKDIWAKLPRNDLRALWDEKMETSQAWQDFVDRLEKVELQNLINRLHQHGGYLNILEKLENLGVDLDEVIRLIKTVIGIEFPERPL